MEETKEIEYRGKVYTVPVWVRFVAMEQDGEIYGFAQRPRIWSGGYSQCWQAADKDAREILIANFSIPDWKDSLIEVPA